MPLIYGIGLRIVFPHIGGMELMQNGPCIAGIERRNIWTGIGGMNGVGV